jgi:hypothetical protein
MTEPEIFDRFPVSVSLSLGDMCLLEHAVLTQLRAAQASALSKDEGDGAGHATNAVKWYSEILAAVEATIKDGDLKYHAAWDAYELAWCGAHAEGGE